MSGPAPLHCPGSALFLDLDGTLLELAEEPDAVRVPDGLAQLLLALKQCLDGAIAIVSGRAIERIDALLAPARLPCAGVHGWMLRDASGRLSAGGTGSTWKADIEPELLAWAQQHPELLLEDKGGSVAVHYRQAPELEEVCRRQLRALAESSDTPLRCLSGKMVVELMPAGRDKGTAIQQLMARPPFASRQPVFIGDDLTDEAGFHHVNALGGRSIRVGSITASAARESLPDVASVHAWLQAAASKGPDRSKPESP